MTMPTPDLNLADLLDTLTPEQVAVEIRDGRLGDIANILRLVLQFREEADAGERRLAILLYAVDLSDLWRPINSGTFENFLEWHAHVSPVRYHNGLRALQVIPASVAREIGFEGAKVAARIDDPQRREEGVRRCQAWVRTNGRPISAETARRVVGLGPAAPNPSTQRRMAVEEENAQLRAEVQRLRNLVVSLGGDPDAGRDAAAAE